MATISQKFRQILSDISNADRRLMDVRTGFANAGAPAPVSAPSETRRGAAVVHTPRNS